MDSGRLNFNGKEILFEENIFGNELDELSQYATQEAPYIPAQFDSKKIEDQRSLWVNKFPKDIILTSPVWKSLKTYIQKTFNPKQVFLHESYILVSQSGDVHYYHKDGGPQYNGRSITTITYLNKEWNIDWAGETLFEENGNLIAGCIPKYGKTIMFDHDINHTTRPPAINCLYRRHVLVNKIELEM
jgi:Rps23 Pro-64 3,4-dihydroxylase Tpa1-like proline 4-hydroxylase